jgi:hypothetical protein
VSAEARNNSLAATAAMFARFGKRPSTTQPLARLPSLKPIATIRSAPPA